MYLLFKKNSYYFRKEHKAVERKAKIPSGAVPTHTTKKMKIDRTFARQ